MIGEATYASLASLLLEKLACYHRENPLRIGVVKEELKNLMGRTVDQRLLQFLLSEQVKAGTVVVEDAYVRLHGHSVALQDAEKKLRENIEHAFRTAKLMPPRVNELVDTFKDSPRKEVLAMLEVLVRENRISRISEDLYFDSATLNDLARDLKEHLRKNGEIDAQGFKQMTGLTRKFSIPLLEYFDRLKLTLRVGDKRILRDKS